MQIKPLSIASVFLLIVLRTFGTLAIASEDVGDVLQRARRLPLLIHSAHFEYAKPGRLSEKRELRIDGDRWFIGVHHPDAPAGEFRRATGFDGQVYHTMTRGEGGLAIYGSQPFASNIQFEGHPLTMPYCWLVENARDLSWHAVKSDAVWQTAIDKMKFLRSDSVGDYRCHVFEINWPGVKYEVWLANDLNGFPIKRTTHRAATALSGTVVYTKFWQNQEGAVIALEGEYTASSSNEPQPTSFVLEDTLRVNTPLESDAFIFNPVNAAQVINVDRSQAAVTPTQGSSRKFLWWLTGIVLAITAIGTYFYRRQK